MLLVIAHPNIMWVLFVLIFFWVAQGEHRWCYLFYFSIFFLSYYLNAWYYTSPIFDPSCTVESFLSLICFFQKAPSFVSDELMIIHVTRNVKKLYSPQLKDKITILVQIGCYVFFDDNLLGWFKSWYGIWHDSFGESK